MTRGLPILGLLLAGTVLTGTALSGCGLEAGWKTESDPTQVFPHQGAYETGTLHGADALRLGTEACASCHDGPTATPSATPCAECHDSWPHPDGFVDGAVHGAGFAEADAAPTETCAACHAAPGLVASTTYACTSCHPSWPHPTSWEASGAHGTHALERGSAVAACGSCHGTDLAGGRIGVGCTDCHEGWPHPEGYAEPGQHGVDHAAGQECGACHGVADDGSADPAGGTTGVACARCHDLYPHPEDYRRAHVAAAGARGPATCMTCHDPGEGPDRGPVVASCAGGCHGGTE